MQRVLEVASIAFAGANLGLLLAEHGYNVGGLDKPEELASIALYLTLAALGTLRAFGGVSRSLTDDPSH
jgi:hypothetical protein